MRPSRVWRPVLAVLLTALVSACAATSGEPAASAPPSGLPTAGPVAPSGPTAGPVAPVTTAPFAQVTPGVVSTDSSGMQQVLISGFDRFFQPGVFHVHVGKVRVILRNDDPSEVHNMIFRDNGGARTKDTLPGQASEVTVVFSKPGLYDFVCSFHELVGMRGQVKVQ